MLNKIKNFLALPVRLTGKQIFGYAFALSLALKPWAEKCELTDLTKSKCLMDFVYIVSGVFLASGIRSFIAREKWPIEKRIQKEMEEQNDQK